MTVKELIEELKELPQDVPVTNNLYCEVKTVELSTYYDDSDDNGEHEFVRFGTKMLPLF